MFSVAGEQHSLGTLAVILVRLILLREDTCIDPVLFNCAQRHKKSCKHRQCTTLSIERGSVRGLIIWFNRALPKRLLRAEATGNEDYI